jgi:hypothetical protein
MHDDDSMSVVTGVSDLSGIDQDLSGFEGGTGDSRRASTTGGHATPLERVTEEAENGPASPASQLSPALHPSPQKVGRRRPWCSWKQCRTAVLGEGRGITAQHSWWHFMGHI